MRYRARAIAVALAAFPVLSSANGGPVAWTEATGTGGVAPRKRSDVRLVSEELVIRLDEDGRRYHVRAEYRLDASAVKGPVLFGVPMTWPAPYPDDAEAASAASLPAEPTDEARAAAGRVAISVAGRPAACRPVAGEARFDETAYMDSYVADGWCVTELALPPAADLPIVLEYDAELGFQDIATSKSALVAYDRRRLRYRLDPAGGWAGPAQRLRARLETGRFDGLVAVKGPPGARRDGAAFAWDLADADLAKLGAIEATVDAEPLLRHRELVTTDFAKPAGIRVTARASSALAAQGAQRYDAARVLDRDAATAWCEGVPGDGQGSWIELSFAPASAAQDAADASDGFPGGCRLEGFALVPGYAKSARAWTENGGPRTLRVSRCGDAKGGAAFALRDADFSRPARDGDASGATLVRARRFDASAVVLTPEWPHDDGPPRCVRVTIVEPAPGPSHDTCVSELRPIFNCG